MSQSQRKQEQTDIGLLTGQGGLEKIYDKLLRGIAGRRMIQVNAAGRKVKDLGIEEPRPGTDIYLTIDLDVQKAAEEGLGSRAGAVVAMDPNTGEILALASHPTYDPNLFPRGISPKDWVQLMNDPTHPMYNRAIQSVYPPGSTFKIIVALAGLDSGVIKLDDTVACKGSLKSGRHSFRCWKKGGHGTVSFHQALVESCDVYFYTMGERIGWDRVAEYARKLGYGSLTGILLPDEKPGLIPTTAWKKKRTGEAWYPGDTYINSIGQGFVLVSPIQACQMISAVANGGHFYRPLLLKQTRNRETGAVNVFSPAHASVITLDPRGAPGSAECAGRCGQRTRRHRPWGRYPARDRRRQDGHGPGHCAEGRRPQAVGRDAGPCMVRCLRAGRAPEDRRGRARGARRARWKRRRSHREKSH